DARLRLDLSDYATFSYVHELLARHGIGQVEFETGVARADLPPLISLLLQDGADEDAFDVFLKKFQATPAQHIALQPSRAVEEEEDAVDDQAREVAKRTYFQSVHVAKEVLTDVRIGRAVNLRRVKRAVQSIIDQVLSNETMMV